MTPEQRIEELWDREQIRDCLYRYCRGVDRGDEAALRSVYWPDATDQHGFYSGSADGFVAWAMGYQPLLERGIHMLGNILIEFRDSGAAVETYWSAYQRGPRPAIGGMGPVEAGLLAGRYIDWFEKRGDEWRIARRVVVFDRSEALPTQPGTELERFGSRQPIGGRFPDDPIYALLGETR